MLSDQVRLVNDFKSKRGVASSVFNELQRILPPQMYLSEITLTPDNHLTVKGTSELMSVIFSFVTDFEKSEYFKTVTSDYTKSRKENDKDVSDFGLSAVLEDSISHGR